MQHKQREIEASPRVMYAVYLERRRRRRGVSRERTLCRILGEVNPGLSGGIVGVGCRRHGRVSFERRSIAAQVRGRDSTILVAVGGSLQHRWFPVPAVLVGMTPVAQLWPRC